MARSLMKRIARIWIVLMALCQLGCHSLSEGAKSEFSKSLTCPIERVEVRARPELHPHDWFQPKKPPSEIASDPERLKMWQDQQEKVRTGFDKYHSIFEARGCGHQTLVECGWSTRGSINPWICYVRPYPPGVSQW
jgi:hypothetical protein